MSGPGKQLSILLRTQDDPNDPTTIHHARMKLPANPSEILDALHHLGCDDPNGVEVRIEDTAKTYLRHLLGSTSSNLMEVDLLAQRLASITLSDSTVLQALIQMWLETTNIPQLINMTHAVDACHVASNVSTPEQLGRFLYDNDMLTAEETEMAMVKSAFSHYDDEYFAILGREYRDAVHGVINGRLYVEYPDWPNLKEVYHPDDCPVFKVPECSLAADFYSYLWEGDEPEQVIHAEFPLSEQEYADILEKLGALEDELVISPTQCLIPEMMHCISLDDTVADLNAFAVCVAGLHARGKLPLYKALLNAHTCEDIRIANDLGVKALEYELHTAVHNPAQYARWHLAVSEVDKDVRLLAEDNLYGYGSRLLESSNDTLTEYGLLHRKDGGPVVSMEIHTDAQLNPDIEQSM